jgi:protocatechuate 3,4-dioxygenase beta subunit
VPGIVHDASNGKSVPGMTLYLPHWEGEWPNAQESIVTTGSDGTFLWKKPPFPYTSTGTRFDVRVLPTDRGAWEMTPVVVQPQSDVPMRTREMLRSLMREAKMRWEGEGENARAVVESPPLGKVAVTVRGTDGQPVRNTPVQVWLAPRWPELGPERSMRYDGKTDSEGKIVLRFFPGPGDLIVTAPGIGYGNTGPFEIRPNQTVTPDLPRLAPFGRIAGKVAPALARPGQIVRLGRLYESDGTPLWAWRQTRVDGQGRFVLRDVTPGRHTVYLFDSEQDAATWQNSPAVKSRHTVTVASNPAQQEEIVLSPLPPRPTLPTPPTPASRPADANTGTLTGVVQDFTGRPVPDATVWAVCSYQGSIRAYHVTLQAQTAGDGSYRMEGVPARFGELPGGSGVSISLTVWKEGTPPTFGYTTTRGTQTTAPALVLPDPRQGGTLVVQARAADGTPLVGALIQAAPQFAPMTPSFSYVGNRSPEESAALRRAIAPHVVTDAAGVARFTGLLADRYSLTAIHPRPTRKPGNSDEEDQVLWSAQFGRGGEHLTASAVGVPVAPGTESRFTLPLQKQSGNLKVRLLLPDGTPVREHSMGLKIAHASNETDYNVGGASTGGSSNQTGIYDFSFAASPGLWRLSARLRPEPPHTSTDREPLLLGQAVVAYSPYQEREVLEIALARVEPGIVQFRVVDENGKPVARATVHQSNYAPFPRENETARVATTDENGQLALTNLRSGEMQARAEVPGDAPLPDIVPNQTGPFPTDAKLENRRRWPAVTVGVRPGETTNQTLRALRVGYLRGTVRGGPEGWIWVPHELRQTLGTEGRYDKTTGEYLIGPLPPGPFEVIFNGASGSVRKTVNIAPGKVMHQDLALDPSTSSLFTAEEERRRLNETLTGSVYLPDGRTPAAGARVLIFDPTTPHGIQGYFWANGAGQFYSHPTAAMPPVSWGDNAARAARPTGGPRVPVVAAFLPGSHGAVFVPLPKAGEKPRLVLPTPLSVRGQVTVAGRPVGDYLRSGVVRVLAACVEQGGLNDILSIETTAQSDGSFTLSGLTPGKYVVQAALGDIYLSAARTITVTDQGTIAPLSLDIPEPGKAQVVELGRQSAGARAYLVDAPPPGPLSERHRPAYYIADGAGRLRLEGLPVGRHRLRLSPGGRVLNVTIER